MAAHTTTRVDLVFVANGKGPESVAVSASLMVSEPCADNNILDDGATCDPLQQWGFAIEEETEVSKPTRTVNSTQPVPMLAGTPASMELLAQESYRFFSAGDVPGTLATEL